MVALGESTGGRSSLRINTGVSSLRDILRRRRETGHPEARDAGRGAVASGYELAMDMKEG
jgi:hypothetical protein